MKQLLFLIFLLSLVCMGNLNDPVKTPVVVIYDINGQELITSFGKAGLSVVDMRYLYDDEDDDLCTIKLQAENVNPLDLVNITYGTNLVIQWGYAGVAISPKVTVVVRDIITKYGTNLIYVELECTDYATYLKTSRGDSSDAVSMLEYLDSKCRTERGYSYKVVIKEFGNVVYKQSKVKLPDLETEWHTPLIYDGPPADPWESVVTSARKKLEVLFNPRTGEELNPVPPNGEIYIDISEELEIFLSTERDFTDGNRSPYQVLRDVFRYAPNGPWYISGRGDTILIHNRALGNAPSKTYHYKSEPGRLIDLQITSEYEAFEQNSVSSPYLNPEEKIAYYEDVYVKELGNLRELNKIISDKSISDVTRKQLLTDFLAVYRASHTYKIKRLDLFATYAGGFTKGNLFPSDQNYALGQFIVADPSKNLVEGHTAPVGMVFDPEFIPQWQTPIPFSIYMLAGLGPDERKDMIDNIAREAEMDKVEAKIITEGDPTLISETIVRLGNIQQIHSGDYYMKKVEHIITNKGYKVQCEAFKVMPKAAIMGISQTAKQAVVDSKGNLIPGSDGQEIIDRYHREKALFGNWDLEIYLDTETEQIIYGGTAISVTPNKVDRYVPLSDFISARDNIPLDELIEDILKRDIRKSRTDNTEER